jgi:hypothetical protein
MTGRSPVHRAHDLIQEVVLVAVDDDARTGAAGEWNVHVG